MMRYLEILTYNSPLVAAVTMITTTREEMMRYLEMRVVQMMRSLVEEMKLAETTRYLVQMMRFLATITLVVMPTSLVRKENTELVKEFARILSYLLFSLSLESSLYFVICDDIQMSVYIDDSLISKYMFNV